MTELDPQEVLRGLIFGDNQAVSYRLLSRKSKIHVNLSKEHLWKFYNSNKGKLQATYVLTGAKDNQRSIVLVSEDELETVKDQFNLISSIHIYSISPSNSNISVLSSLDLQAQNLDRKLNCGDKVKLGFIKNPLLDDGYLIETKVKAVAVTPATGSAVKSNPTNAMNNSKSLNSAGISKPVNSTSISDDTGSSKSTKALNTSTTASTITTKPDTKKSSTTGKSDAFGAFKGGWKDGSGSKPDPFAQLSKPRRVPKPEKVVIADHDDDIEMADVKDSETSRQVADKREKELLALESIFVDMSDEEEEGKNINEKELETEKSERSERSENDSIEKEDTMDVDNEETQPDELPEPAPSPQSTLTTNKTKKRKRVEKVVHKKNEKGYLVTTTEVVWVTDSEGEDDSATAVKKSIEKKPLPRKIPSKSKGKGVGKGQSSLMSFFGKK